MSIRFLPKIHTAIRQSCSCSERRSRMVLVLVIVI